MKSVFHENYVCTDLEFIYILNYSLLYCASTLDLILSSKGRRLCQEEVLVPEISLKTELMSWHFNSQWPFVE